MDKLSELGELIKLSFSEKKNTGFIISSISSKIDDIVCELRNHLELHVEMYLAGCLELCGSGFDVAIIPKRLGIFAIRVSREEKFVDVFAYRKTFVPDSIICDGEVYEVRICKSYLFYDSYVMNEIDDEFFHEECKRIAKDF